MPQPWRRPPRRGSDLHAGTPVATLPQATTLAATQLEDTTATLNGAVNPRGVATSWWFVYGLTTLYGSTSPTGSLDAGSIPVALDFQLTGLTVGQTYHFAIVAQNAAGTVYGADMTFIAKAPVVPPPAPAVELPFADIRPAQPHFAFPFKVKAEGVQVDEQDTISDIFSCAQAIAVCPQGACPEMPVGFGMPDLTFSGAPLDTVAMTDAIQRWEPRATETATATATGYPPDPDSGVWQVALTTSAQGEGPNR